MTNGPAERIEEFFRRRYGREAIYFPSGRLALYIAFREWLKPGDRILMSPVTDDVVFFTVLAAGLIPVLGPIDLSTGNLDPAAVDEGTWSGLQAVMTTNLYGIPDRMDLLMDRCRRHGLFLVEDACHAFDSHFKGKRIGEFGPVAAFSMEKHLKAVGGVLTFSDAQRRDVLVQRANDEIRRLTLVETLKIQTLSILRELVDKTGTKGQMRRVRNFIAPLPKEREGYRQPCKPDEVLRARMDGGGLDRFSPWVVVDNHHYRHLPPTSQVRRTLRLLESFEQNRERRIEGARKLEGLHLSTPSLRHSLDFALFKVPLFVRNRETVASHFIKHGVSVDYIYDPPLDIMVPRQLADRVPSPAETVVWSRDVLPIEPLQADKFVKLLKESPPLIPAWPRD